MYNAACDVSFVIGRGEIDGVFAAMLGSGTRVDKGSLLWPCPAQVAPREGGLEDHLEIDRPRSMVIRLDLPRFVYLFSITHILRHGADNENS